MSSLLGKRTPSTHLHRGLRLASVGVTACLLLGCAGKGEINMLDLRTAMPTAPSAQPTGALTVAVTGFDDASPQKGRLGSRTHLGGGTSYFDLTGGKPGEVVAQLVATHLKKRGWRVEIAQPGAPAQVTIAGKILDLAVNARSSFGSTGITASSKIAVEAVNAADGSTVRMTLTGEGSQTVVWFDTEDAQTLLAETVSESLEKLIAGTKVENNMLRLK